MFLTPLKAVLTHALKATLDSDYVNAQFRNTHVSIEFPDAPQHYPGVWVDFEPTGEMQTIGIGHTETDGNAEGGRQFSRWTFQGYASYTVAALTSLERDRLMDELLRIFAFGHEHESTSEFRSIIEDNDLLALNIDFDQVALRGTAVAQGTPWGSEEMVYEGTLALEVLGEFVSDALSATLIPLSGIVVATAYTAEEGDPDPTW